MKVKAFLTLIFLLFQLHKLQAVPQMGHKILITGSSPIANRIGHQIALEGGNLVDVAVGVGLAMAVTHPYNASLGGGGFALIDMGQEVEVLDFRETAPSLTHPEYYTQNPKGRSSIQGGSAVGVPGVVAGYWAMHKKHGHLPWRKLFTEAIRIADEGFRVSGEWAEKTKKQHDSFSAVGKEHFPILKPGEIHYQKKLFKVLKKIRSQNVKGFYEGDVANDIIQSVRSSGGDMVLKDLATYQVRWLKPLQIEFNGYKIFLMPPPSSGGVVIASALKMIEQMQLKKIPTLSAQEFYILSEIHNRSFRGRSLMGDPDYHKNPVEKLLSQKYIDQMVRSISKSRVKKIKALSDKSLQESTETTHFNVMNSQGQAIAITLTLNGNYGSGVVSKKYGISLNNEMDDFTTQPGKPNLFGLVQGHSNAVEPGKRPLSSMSPTLIKKDKKTIMALGAPGGPRIISGVIQTIYRHLYRDYDLDQSIQAPRIHHQYLPEILFVDEKRFSPEIIKSLKKKGYKVEESWMARVNAIRINDLGILEGAFDSRAEGSVVGH